MIRKQLQHIWRKIAPLKLDGILNKLAMKLADLLPRDLTLWLGRTWFTPPEE